MAILLAHSQPGLAQDQQAPPRLEDLIPDEALENPEEWAGDGVPDAPIGLVEPEDAASEAAAEDAAEDIAEAIDPGAPEPDTPLAELPTLGLEWPDDLELAELDLVEPDDSIEFAELDTEPVEAMPDAETFRISNELVLAFPDDNDAFPERTAFLERFKALSTIEQLESDGDNLSQLAARAREDEELLGTLLRIYGYYDAQIIRTVGGASANADVADDAETRAAVRFDVLPGRRYRVGEVDLGQLQTAPDYTALRAEFGVGPGDFLSNDVIVEEQLELDTALGETGYPFAAIEAPELLIDHARREGDLTMDVLPGGKYAFGDVISSLPEFPVGQASCNHCAFRSGRCLPAQP